MNLKQKSVIGIWVVIVIAVCLVPPWNYGNRGPLITKKIYNQETFDVLDMKMGAYEIDKNQLKTEILMVSIISLSMVLILHDKKKETIRSICEKLRLAHRDIALFCLLVLIVSTAVYVLLRYWGMLPHDPNEGIIQKWGR